jgi:hypothetical protein
LINTQKAVIPFKLINNLIFIPVNINGANLTFMLDTGVAETIFSVLKIKSSNLEMLKNKIFRAWRKLKY